MCQIIIGDYALVLSNKVNTNNIVNFIQVEGEQMG